MLKKTYILNGRTGNSPAHSKRAAPSIRYFHYNLGKSPADWLALRQGITVWVSHSQQKLSTPGLPFLFRRARSVLKLRRSELPAPQLTWFLAGMARLTKAV